MAVRGSTLGRVHPGAIRFGWILPRDVDLRGTEAYGLRCAVRGGRRHPTNAMPKVIILPTELSGEVNPGENLLDAGMQAGVEMEAGCFNGSCGTCIVEVVHGMENLSPTTVEEIEVLNGWKRDPDRYRLACCTRVLRGEVTIRQPD